MALLKTIELDSGIVLNYHRIVTISKITNHSTILEIAGYTSEAKRDQEIRQKENKETITVYIDTTLMSVDYDENTTIKDWYNYLKTTEKYSGAEDDAEEAGNVEEVVDNTEDDEDTTSNEEWISKGMD